MHDMSHFQSLWRDIDCWSYIISKNRSWLSTPKRKTSRETKLKFKIKYQRALAFCDANEPLGNQNS